MQAGDATSEHVERIRLHVAGLPELGLAVRVGKPQAPIHHFANEQLSEPCFVARGRDASTDGTRCWELVLFG